MDANITKKEKTPVMKVIGYGLGNASQAMETMVIAQLTYYLTNSVYMAAATVGVILMCARLFDGFTDFLAGFIVDRTNTRWGKGRPYALIYIPMWIGMILLFSVPNVSEKIQILYVFVLYVFIEAVCRTLGLCASTIHLMRAFKSKMQVNATTVCAAFGLFAGIGVSIILPVLIAIFEDKPHGWTIIALIFAIPATIFALLDFLLVPETEAENYEKKDDETTDKKKTAESVPVLVAVKAVLRNKYMLAFDFSLFFYAVSQGIAAAGTYYFTYIIGDLSMLSIVSMFVVMSFITMCALPVLKNKLGIRKTLELSMAVAAVAYALRYLFPTNVLGLSLMYGVAQMGVLPISGFQGLAAIDCMKYTKWKDGIQVEGVMASVNGIATKVGNGVGAAIIGILMAIAGFDGAAAVQSQSSLDMISFLYLGLPAILCVLSIISVHFYKLDEQIEQIEKDLAGPR